MQVTNNETTSCAPPLLRRVSGSMSDPHLGSPYLSTCDPHGAHHERRGLERDQVGAPTDTAVAEVADAQRSGRDARGHLERMREGHPVADEVAHGHVHR